MGFAKAWDCAGLVVANLYALRATQPADLWKHADPVGENNDMMLAALIREHETVVCAWGANARPDRVAIVRKMFHRLSRPMCLGITANGSPRHPLYIRADRPLVDWTPPPSTLAQQVAGATAEMETWTDERRKNVRLAGGDQP